MFFNRRKKKYNCLVTYRYRDAHGVAQYRNWAMALSRPTDPLDCHRLAEWIQAREKSPELPVILNLIWF